MTRQWRRTACTSVVRSLEARRLISACLAVVLLAFQVVGALLASPPLAFDPDRIEICTESGFMVLGHDGKPEKSSQTAHNGHCLFCQPLLHAGAPPAAQEIIARLRPPEFPEFRVLAAPPTTAGLAPLAGAASPQAPPVSV
jgi:hypothetical protein